MRRFLISIILLSLFQLLFSGCGGGSSSTPATSNVAPGVSSVTPVDRAQQIAINSNLIASFTKDMDSTTITAATFTLKVRGGAAVAGSVVYEAATRTATFTPTSLLGNGTTYTATLASAIKDSSGTPLTTFSWEFTTVSRTVQFGTVRDDTPAGIALDSSGNVYVAGSTKGSFDVANQGGSDIFLAKYDRSGIPSWVRQFGTANEDIAGGVAVDSSGNIYVTGATAGGLAGTNSGSYDIFLAKYDSSGSQLWVRQLGTSMDDIPTGVAVGSNGVWVAGYSNAQLPVALINPYSGGYDAFLLKYDFSGNLQWATQIGSTGNDFADGLTLDAADNAYLAGETNNQLPGAVQISNRDAILVKVSNSGAVQWARQVGVVSNTTVGARAAVDDNAGIVYLTGTTTGSLDGTSSGGIFLTAYKTDGSTVIGWPQQFGTTATDNVTGIALDSSGNVYLSGYTGSAFSGLTSSGSDDAFLARFTPAGDRSYIYQFGTAAADRAWGIARDRVTTSFYLTGSTTGGMDGNSNKDSSGTTTDIFITLHDPAAGTKQ